MVSGSADLLIELGCEELPPKSLPKVGQALFDGFLAQLNKAELEFDAAASRLYYTPRRLALLISGVAESQPDQVLERKGPALAAAFNADKQPTPAALGFARSVGKSVEELETFKTDKGEWLYCRVEKAGQKLEDLLFPMLEKVLAALPVAKPMRWASNDFSFIRPVHWLVAMHGSKILEGSLFGLKTGNTTRGHRIHSPGPHEIATAGDYEQVLEAAYVVADQKKRQDIIRSQAVALGDTSGGKALINQDLLNEVTCLVEWPRSISGSFDAEFLDVPAEALIASMQDHQKFFPIVSSDKAELMARFITVTNIESQDFDAVREGFERVIRPRLADARFFWDQDNKKTLEDLLPQLDNVVFQKKLGSIRDKSKRISAISKILADVTGNDKDTASRAATLCKCDLVSHMVGEFPELQGIMGSYYALQSGEQATVAQAIGEHYLPAYSGDRLPSQAVGKVVASAVPGGDIVYVKGEKGYMAIRSGGSGDVTESHMVWKYKGIKRMISTPLLYNDRLYIFDRYKPIMACIDAKTGKEKWSGSLGEKVEFCSSPTAADGRIYGLKRDGSVWILAAGDTLTILDTIALEESKKKGKPSDSSIAIAQGCLFIRTAKNLYCVK